MDMRPQHLSVPEPCRKQHDFPLFEKETVIVMVVMAIYGRSALRMVLFYGFRRFRQFLFHKPFGGIPLKTEGQMS